MSITWRGQEAYQDGKLLGSVCKGRISDQYYFYESDGHIVETVWNAFSSEDEAKAKFTSFYTPKAAK